MFEHGCSRRRWILGCTIIVLVMTSVAQAAPSRPSPPPSSIDNPIGIPDVRQVLPTATDGKGVSSTMQIFVIMTVLMIAPSIVIMMTCFTRILIVLALLRQAIGTPQLPPTQILMGLALFMSMLVMAPTWSRIKEDAVDPYMNNQIPQKQAIDAGMMHLRDFMFRQIEKTGNEQDIYLFLGYSRTTPIQPNESVLPKDVPSTVLIPSFILSELKTSFIMGFRIYLPFLVIDMVIASILISMGMMMLPPVLISLPFKLLLFVLADGWHLVVGSLLDSFDHVPILSG